jgi:hypothetical protein
MNIENQNKEIELKSNVMKRVRNIHSMRVVIRPLLIELMVIIAATVSLMYLVSVPNVLKNMSNLSGPGHYLKYLFEAFLHTEFVVQIFIAIAILGAIFFVINLIKNFYQVLNLIKTA